MVLSSLRMICYLSEGNGIKHIRSSPIPSIIKWCRWAIRQNVQRSLWRLDVLMEDHFNIASPASCCIPDSYSCYQRGPCTLLWEELRTRLDLIRPDLTRQWQTNKQDRRASTINTSTREHSRLIKQCLLRIQTVNSVVTGHYQTTWSTDLPHQAKWWSYLKRHVDHLKHLPSPPPVTEDVTMTSLLSAKMKNLKKCFHQLLAQERLNLLPIPLQPLLSLPHLDTLTGTENHLIDLQTLIYTSNYFEKGKEMWCSLFPVPVPVPVHHGAQLSGYDYAHDSHDL